MKNRKQDRALRAQRAAMDAIPMVGDSDAYRRRIADFVSGFDAAYADMTVEVVVDKAWKQFQKSVSPTPVAQDALVANLAMMIRRLSYAVKRHGGHEIMVSQAVKLLKDNNLNGSILRDEYSEGARQ